MCVDSATHITKHLMYRPHGADVDECARCGEKRHPNHHINTELPPLPPPRPFIELECE